MDRARSRTQNGIDPGKEAARARQLLLLDLARGIDGKRRPRSRPRAAPCSSPSLHAPTRSARRAAAAAPGASTTNAMPTSPSRCVRHPDHRGAADGRMAEQEVLDLGGVRVEAADDEHVLLPPDDAQAPPSVDHPEVTGVQPALARRPRARSRSDRRDSRASRCSRARAPRRALPPVAPCPSSSAIRTSRPGLARPTVVATVVEVVIGRGAGHRTAPRSARSR